MTADRARAVPVEGPAIDATSRRWLVFTSAGDHAVCDEWVHDGRGWDLWVAYYGDRPAPRFTCDLFTRRKGAKFQNLQACFAQHPEIFARYEAVLVIDDDLGLEPRDIDRLFEIRQRHDLWILQPAFDPRGRVSHRLTLPRPFCELRLVTFVEVGAPLFRTDRLAAFLDRYDPSLVGWGIDEWFIAMNMPAGWGRVAIVDSVIAHNPAGRAGTGHREIDRLESPRTRRKRWEAKAKELGLPRAQPRRTIARRPSGRSGLLRGVVLVPRLAAAHTRLSVNRLKDRVRGACSAIGRVWPG